MTRGAPLHQLQNLDLEFDNGQRRISEIVASLGETEALRRARQAFTDAEAQQRKWGIKVRDLELEIEGLSSKITANENRLYSGSVTNPKELTDMQGEIASLKRRRVDLEDKLLEAMVFGEEAETILEERSATLAETENDWQTRQSALKNELSELETRLHEVREERERARQLIAEDDLALYDKLRSRFGSITVTTLRDGVCGYCAVAPSSTKLARLRSGRELLLCGNCGRILLDL